MAIKKIEKIKIAYATIGAILATVRRRGIFGQYIRVDTLRFLMKSMQEDIEEEEDGI